MNQTTTTLSSDLTTKIKQQWSSFGEWLMILYRAHLPSHVSRQFIQHRFLQVAASLAYQTILSMVPLIVVGFSLLNVFVGSSADILSYLLVNFIPVQPEKINDILGGLPSLSSPQAIGAIGLGTLLIVALTLFSNIEAALNNIWRVTSKRSLLLKFMTFYSLLTLAPLLLSIGLYLASQITETSGLFTRFMPSVLTFIVFFFCYKLLPEPNTRWRATITGGLVGSAFFEISKWGFSLYLAYAADKSYATIYGTLGILPLFFIWVYVSWIVFLLGGQVAYSVQNIELLAELDRQQDAATISEDLFDQASDEAAIRLFYEVSEAYQCGAPPPDAEHLALAIPMPALTVQFLLDRFLARGLILAVTNGGFVPARPPAQIDLFELIDGLRTPRIALDYVAMQAPLRNALEDLKESRRKSLQGTSFAAVSGLNSMSVATLKNEKKRK
jgi:membrane protein